MLWSGHGSVNRSRCGSDFSVFAGSSLTSERRRVLAISIHSQSVSLGFQAFQLAQNCEKPSAFFDSPGNFTL